MAQIAQTGSAGTRIPVHLFSGFLGSGKSTLINGLLAHPRLRRAAVIVAEAGDVRVDRALIAARPDMLRVIDHGCLCGEVHDEIASSMLELLRSQGSQGEIPALFIEPSGLSDPVPIIQTLLTDRKVSQFFELQTVVTVVDGVRGLESLHTQTVATKQLAVADTIVISKADRIADDTAMQALQDTLAASNPQALRHVVVHGEIDPARLLRASSYAGERDDASRGRLHAAAQAADARRGDAEVPVRSFSVVHRGDIDMHGFVLWLNLVAGQFGGGLLRMKGVACIEGRGYAVHAVQSVISEPVELDAGRYTPGESVFTFIVRGLDERQLRASLDVLRFRGEPTASAGSRLDPARYALFKDVLSRFRSLQLPAGA